VENRQKFHALIANRQRKVPYPGRFSQSSRHWRRALNDGAKFAGWQQTERAARLVVEPRRAKGIGDGCRRVLQEQRPLHSEGKIANDGSRL
jgi:hypothetical protein